MLNVELDDGVAQGLRFEGGMRMCMFKFDVQRGGLGVVCHCTILEAM